jgi:L-rhamnose isomerase/sugar isomerase
VTPRNEHEELAGRLSARGVDVDAVESALRALVVETPSWGYGDSGTRFGVFPQPGRPRSVFERVDDAAEVHRLTGTAGAVALHFPWDAVSDVSELAGHIEASGLRVGAVNPNLFQDPDYVLGSVTNPDPAIRARAEAHLLECIDIATALGSTAQSLWLADGTNYPGQDDLMERRGRMLDSLARVYAQLPAEQEYLVEYKLFEPAFYATELADWGSALLVCQRLGGFHFNNRKYADDDLIVGSVNPFELFLVFCQLVGGGMPLPRLTIDQSHNVEAKVEAMVMSVVNIQDAYARALIVDREALRSAGASGDVLAGHQVLLDAYNTDVRPLCASARRALGAAADPVAALRSSGRTERVAAERAAGEAIRGAR